MSKSLKIGAILAGGGSRRMGADKAEMELAGVSLLARVVANLGAQVDQVILSGGQTQWSKSFDLKLIPDALAAKLGPLGGLCSVMQYMAATGMEDQHFLCTAVDMPFIPNTLAQTLIKDRSPGQAVLPTYGGRLQPLAGLWPAGWAGDLKDFLESGQNPSIKAFLAGRQVCERSFDHLDLDPFENINKPEDLAAAAARLAASQ